MLRRGFLKAWAFGLALATAAALAGPLVTGSRGAAPPPSGENATRISTALTGFTVPFSYSTPSDPVTTSSATVNTSTISSNIVAGRALTLQAGSYSGLTINVNDVDLILQSGVTIDGLTISADRVRITGGGSANITSVVTLSPGTTDFIADNVTMTLGTFESISCAEDGSLRRIAFINTTLRSSDNWGLIGCNGAQDFIIARSDWQDTDETYSTLRVVGVVRLIEVNNRFSTGAQQHRHHNTNTNGDFAMSYVFISGNQYESNGSHAVAQLYVEPQNAPGDGASLQMHHVWITNNSFYRDSTNGVLEVAGTTPSMADNFTVTGNRAYMQGTVGSNMGGISGSMSNSTVSDNLIQAVTTAPAYSYGAN